MSNQTLCIFWSMEHTYIDNDPEQEEVYEYCNKKHCEVNNEGCPCCSSCLDYVDILSTENK